jgi:hypothetical protein
MNFLNDYKTFIYKNDYYIAKRPFPLSLFLFPFHIFQVKLRIQI